MDPICVNLASGEPGVAVDAAAVIRIFRCNEDREGHELGLRRPVPAVRDAFALNASALYLWPTASLEPA